ncbi:BRCT domain-containing protein [Cladochytrium replicatum]|nr:BRCT domain-containing protein [Cladochytrium replicatum]
MGGAVLTGVVVCTTNLTEAEKGKVQKTVTELDGEFSPHLVPDWKLALKWTKVATNLRIPVVKLSWVEEISGRSLDESWSIAELSEITDRHRLQPLEGCVVCVTGLEATDRDMFENLVKKNGGTFSPDLSRHCTHLIAKMPQGKKYEFAKKWGIEIVTGEWLMKSHAAGSYIPTDAFRLKGASQDVDRTLAREKSHEISAYFARCRIYISSSFPDSDTRSLRALVRTGGGALPTLFDPQMTHVIANGSDLSPKDRQIVEKLRNVPCVSPAWLEECARKQLLVPTQPYELKYRIGPSVPHSAPSDSSKEPFTNPFKRDPLKEQPSNIVPSGADSQIPISGDYPPIFARKKFFCSGFSKEQEYALKEAITVREGAFSGSLRASKLDPESNSYLIVPFGPKSKEGISPPPGVHIVTDAWLEFCNFYGKLYEVKESPLFSPIPSIPIPGFKSFVITLTGHSGPHRHYLRAFCLLAGAKFTDTLTKQNTHLISSADAMNSQKYRRAVEWRIKIVDEEWLFSFIRENNVQAKFHTNLPDIPTNGPQPQITVKTQVPQPGGNGVKLPVFQVEDALECLKSIEHNDDSEVNVGVFERGLQKAVQQVKQAQAEQLLSINNAKAETESACLSGVVMCFNPKLMDREQHLRNIAVVRGATIVSRVQTGCTHYVHHIQPTLVVGTRLNETFRDFKRAKQLGIFIVSPCWLEKCNELGIRVDESDYPHTYDPTRVLPISLEEQTNSTVSESKVDSPSKRSEFVAITAPENSSVSHRPSGSSVGGGGGGESILWQVALQTNEKKPIRWRGSVVQSMGMGGVNETTAVEERADSILENNEGFDDDGVVTYEDEHGIREKRKLLHQLSAGNKRMRSTDSLSEFVNQQKQNSRPPSPVARCFMITGIPQADRAKMQLGATVLELDCWDDRCTHLIVGKPNRTEKCLAAIASGVWVLRPSYVYASDDSGCFVDEDEHEWNVSIETPAEDHQTILAARRWRTALSDGDYTNKAFSGWNILLLVEGKKRDGYLRVLRAGGAMVTYDVRSARDIEHVEQPFTHCMTDATTMVSEDLKKLLRTWGTTICDVGIMAEALLG